MQRPESRALEIAKGLKEHGATNEEMDELVQILTDIDGRGARNEPSKRTPRAKATAKSAKLKKRARR